MGGAQVGRLEATQRFPANSALEVLPAAGAYNGEDLRRLGCISSILPFQYSTYSW